MKKAKKLTLTEMWDLYLVIGDGYNNPDIIDESVETLKNMNPYDIGKVLQTLYPNVIAKNSLDAAFMFMRGLRQTGFFDFQSLIGSIHGSSKR